MSLITSSAVKAGFKAGVLVDFPNSTKLKKYYLVLDAGGRKIRATPLTTAGDQKRTKIQVARNKEEDESGRFQRKRGRKRKLKGSETKRDWVKRKKELRKRRGLPVKGDSKYSTKK